MTAKLFDSVVPGPADPILGLTTAFNQCTAKDKVNLGVGAYRCENGKPLVFKAVLAAEKQLLSETEKGTANKEYLGSGGNPDFIKECQRVVLGKHANRFATVQAIGGTGALRIGFEYSKVAINKFNIKYPKEAFPKTKSETVLLSKPTWPNHYNVAYDSGFSCEEYHYFDADTLSVDEAGMVKSLESKVKENTVVLLHAIGHNPTGADPSSETFRKIFKLIEDRNAICFMDIAYQGFVSGDLDEDLRNVKLALDEFPKMNLIIAQSFSKNMGMYGERLGACHISCPSPERVAHVKSQVNLVIRRLYSSPPRHPSDIGLRVMNNPDNYKMWQAELKEVADRINEMRKLLRDGLCAKSPAPGDWKHITDQKGMFAYTGLTPEHVAKLADEHSIFMAKDGRISVAGLNKHNIDKVIGAIATVRHEVSRL